MKQETKKVLKITLWGVFSIVVVAFIAFCTCLIMEHVSDCTAPPDSTEASSSKDEE